MPLCGLDDYFNTAHLAQLECHNYIIGYKNLACTAGTCVHEYPVTLIPIEGEGVHTLDLTIRHGEFVEEVPRLGLPDAQVLATADGQVAERVGGGEHNQRGHAVSKCYFYKIVTWESTYCPSGENVVCTLTANPPPPAKRQYDNKTSLRYNTLEHFNIPR